MRNGLSLQRAELFNQMLKFGEEGERIAAEKLLSKGVAVSPLYQFSPDSPPFLLTDIERVILPDLTCWKNGANFFVECKRKKQWVSWNGELETGLDLRHFNDYLKVKKITGSSIYIFFIHEDTMKQNSGIFYNEIEILKPNSRVWDGKVNGKRVSKPLILFKKQNLKKGFS